MAQPLTSLTKKDNFQWGPKSQAAFDKLKTAMVTALIFATAGFQHSLWHWMWCLGYGNWCSPHVDRHPIAYFSKIFSPKNLTKSAYECEIMALALAVQHWRHYFLGRKFRVFSDQKSLGYLLHQRITTPDQQNLVAKLLGYNFEIIYKPCRDNCNADALSCCEDRSYNSMLSFPI